VLFYCGSGPEELPLRRFQHWRERAAAIYTLLGTAKLNSLDPEFYLRHVLERIADHPINRIHELLPWTLAAVLPTHLT
jgi:hypothetical protein